MREMPDGSWPGIAEVAVISKEIPRQAASLVLLGCSNSSSVACSSVPTHRTLSSGHAMTMSRSFSNARCVGLSTKSLTAVLGMGIGNRWSRS